VLLDPAGAHAIEGSPGGQHPAGGLNRGRHHQLRRPEDDRDGNGGGSGDQRAGDVKTAHEPMDADVPPAQPAGELEGGQDEGERAAQPMHQHPPWHLGITPPQERAGIEQLQVALIENEDRHHREGGQRDVLQLHARRSGRNCGHDVSPVMNWFLRQRSVASLAGISPARWTTRPCDSSRGAGGWRSRHRG